MHEKPKFSVHKKCREQYQKIFFRPDGSPARNSQEHYSRYIFKMQYFFEKNLKKSKLRENNGIYPRFSSVFRRNARFLSCMLRLNRKIFTQNGALLKHNGNGIAGVRSGRLYTDKLHRHIVAALVFPAGAQHYFFRRQSKIA